MNLQLCPMTIGSAIEYLKHKGCQLPESDKFVPEFAISIVNESRTIVGAILMGKTSSMMRTDLGENIDLIQVYGDGTAQVQTLLYGAAWRAAKALGYKTITL